jgi:predicted metalloprotease with PDZ domain
MQTLWHRYGRPELPYTDQQLLDLVSELSGLNLESFWQNYLYGTTELDYDHYFAPFGLKLQAQINHNIPYTGITFATVQGALIAKTVVTNSPAQLAGIDAGDEIIAINHRRVNLEQINQRLQNYRSGETLEFTIFAQDELRTVSVTLSEPVVDRFVVSLLPDLHEMQLKNLSAWLNPSQ